jgi:hypothetical protein
MTALRLVDIYMPDFKWWTSESAKRYGRASGMEWGALFILDYELPPQTIPEPPAVPSKRCTGK